MFRNKKVLVAGGTGLIGIPLVKRLFAQGATVRIASLDDPSRAHPEAQFLRLDLTILENCLTACAGMDFVFNLLCVKGSPAVTVVKPASFFTPMVLFNTSLLEAARRRDVEGYLYTSSIGAYPPAEIFREDDIWNGSPSPHDRFAGGAKRIGELQVEAYRIEYGWKNTTIVRPANVYGPYDNFDSVNAMVVPSLIKRAVDGENPMVVWGDGSAERDFIHADDVARGILMAVDKAPGQNLNLASGLGLSVKQLVETVISNLKSRPEIVWDASKPVGDRKRVMDVSRAEAIGFKTLISIEEGVKSTMDWYRANRDQTRKRYDVFDRPPGS